MPSAMPVPESFLQEAAPSVVRQMTASCVWHCVAGEPALSRRPVFSSTNATSPLIKGVGSVRSSHVLPRSAERKRGPPATSAQTPVPDGALSCPNDGSAIGDGDAVGWLVHAVRTRTRRSNARIGSQASHRPGRPDIRLSSPQLVRFGYERGWRLSFL